MAVESRDSESGEVVYVDPLPPDLPIPGPNEPLPLFEGIGTVATGGSVWHGQVSIHVRWLPKPALICHFTFPDVDHDALGPEAPLNDAVAVTVEGATFDGRYNGGHRRPTDEPPWLDLRIYDPVVAQRAGEATKVRFLLVNMESYYGDPIRLGERGWRAGRLRLRSTAWDVRVDEVDQLHDLESSLRRSGGYGITHLVEATKCDGSVIQSNEAKALLSVVQFALSFAEARWITPVRARGLTADDQVAWEIWGLWQTSQWSDPMTWYASRSTAGLDELFALIDDRWSDLYWERLLRSAIHYYIDSSGGLVNRQLVMGTALVELAGWHVVVEERRLMSGAGFDRLVLEDKFRLLLGLLSIDVDVPADLAELEQLARQRNWDGPKAIAEMRHSVVHARRHHTGWELKPEVWADASLLLEHYCDVAVLGLLGYQGLYVNRVTCRSAQDHQRVPWSVRDPEG